MWEECWQQGWLDKDMWGWRQGDQLSTIAQSWQKLMRVIDSGEEEMDAKDINSVDVKI